MFYFVSVTAISHVHIIGKYLEPSLQNYYSTKSMGVGWGVVGVGVGIRMIHFTQIHFTQFHSTQRKLLCIRFDNILSYSRDDYPT